MYNLINIWKFQKEQLEKKLRELNKKRNFRESKAYKNLSADYNQLIRKIDYYQSSPSEIISQSNLSQEGIRYLDNSNLSIDQKLAYINLRRDHLKKQLKICTWDVFDIFFNLLSFYFLTTGIFCCLSYGRLSSSLTLNYKITSV